MSWKQWSLKEWNEALVLEVFLAHERAESTVSRIDASGRFLAKCTKDNDCNAEEARQLFINTFGTTATSVRAKFRWTWSYKSTTAPDKIPSCFAPLYLTLLAASADNETAGVGDFRKRFSEIVKVTNGLSVDFVNLPLMWNAVQAWADIRHKTIGDCALLVLPDPKREKLIGYSKRIAFPVYRDEIFLRKTLHKSNLSESSPFVDVSHAVAREINRANTLENFREEFREFNRLVARAEFQSAYETPFWGAVRDICFEDTQEIARNKGLANLSIEITDPSDPYLNLYLDELAAKRIGIPIKELNFARRDGCKFIAFENGQQLSANNLNALARDRKIFRDIKIGKFLFEGWLIFLPDQMGELSSEGSFYEGGPVCIVAKDSELLPLIKFNESLGVKVTKLSSNGMLEGWTGIHIQAVSELFFSRLLSYIPESIRVLLRRGWTSPRPRLSGGSWYGQMLLLNPASNPIVKMLGAVKGEYRFLDVNSNELKREALVLEGDGFQIPSKELNSLDSKINVCEFILSTALEKQSKLKIPLIFDPLEGQPAKIRDRMQWLVDSPTGVLCRMDEVQESFNSKLPPSNKKLFTSNIFPPPLMLELNSFCYECTNNELNFSNSPLNWITDALVLRFERRSSLTFDLLDQHVKGAAELAGVNTRDLRKLLFYGQWIRTQTQRSAPFSSVSRSEIEMIMISRNGELIARIVGMISRQSAYKLAKILQPNEYFSQIRATDLISIGCIEIKLISKDRAAEIAQQIGARIVLPYPGFSPLAALNPSATEVQVLDSAIGSNQVEKWIWGWSFVQDAQSLWPIGELRRTVNGPKAWYWIKLAEAQFLKTDSITWAWMISSIANGRKIAHQNKQGEIFWDRNIVTLPASLTRWWMIFGGGCIALTDNGQVLFTGYDCQEATNAMGWKSDLIQQPQLSVALKRRKLALRLKSARRILVN